MTKTVTKAKKIKIFFDFPTLFGKKGGAFFKKIRYDEGELKNIAPIRAYVAIKNVRGAVKNGRSYDMGLIKAGLGAVGGNLADQWKEYFYCEAMPENVIAVKGEKRIGGRTSNTKGTDNIISRGSVIAVADGQFMMIVEQGKVVEVCAEPGEFIFDNSTEPSIFAGEFGESLKESFRNIGKRFTFGGEPPKDQRVYYFNTKELVGNKYGTAGAIPFRVVDKNVGLDVDIAVKCFGEYSYHIIDPVRFYTNVCANVPDAYYRESIDSQLKTELLTALQPAFAKISAQGIRYSEVPGHADDLAAILNEELSDKWKNLRGVEIVSVGVSSIKASEEDERMIKELQRNAALRDPQMAAAHLAGATAAALQTAAANEGGMGAMGAFVGMGMAGNVTGGSMQNLYQMAQNQQGGGQPPQGSMGAQPPQGGTAGGWTCSCGTVNQGNFCGNCGSPRPQQDWTCSCGTVNSGNFCSNCGSKRP